MRTSSQLREQDWLLPDGSLHILLARTATGKISPSCSFLSIGFLAQQNASISGSDPDTQFRCLVVMTIFRDLCPGPSLEDPGKGSILPRLNQSLGCPLCLMVRPGD